MRTYLAISHSALESFISVLSMQVGTLFAPTSDFLIDNDDCDSEELEYLLSVAAGEKALELRHSDSAPGLVLAIEIDYNPENKKVMMYNLIGELNEIIAHELRHVEQKSKKTFSFDKDEDFVEIEDPFEYYSQPKELDAQLHGFKRLSKLTKKPLDFVVKNWFDTHKNFHSLDYDQQKEIINMILSYR